MSADRAVHDPLHRLADGVVVTPAEAGDQAQSPLGRLLAAGQDRADAGGVDGHGLFAEDVLAGLHSGLEVLRAEVRRRGEDHHVHVALEHLLVGVEPGELPLLGHVDAVAEGPLQRAVAPGHALGEEVGHRHELGVRVGGHGVAGGPRPAPAAANQADPQHVAPGRMGGTVDGQAAGQAAAALVVLRKSPAAESRPRASGREVGH